MATGAQAPGWRGPSRRRGPRFQLQGPLDVTVLRSGVPDTLPARSLDLGERGIAVMLAGELTPGEVVSIEVPLPLVAGLLRTRAIVRYHDQLRCGLEFVALSVEQRATIRDWAKEAKVEMEFVVSPVSGPGRETAGAGNARKSVALSWPGKAKTKWFARAPIAALILLAVAGGVLWWRWNRAWEELESGLKNGDAAVAEKPQAQVPAEVMEKLVIHRVEPVYPADARRANLQGIIALDIVVGRDGSVASMHALNGPDVLARAAMDALRWWRFEPYRLNGEPAAVETTVAVEFKR
jgi:TonB family protein